MPRQQLLPGVTLEGVAPNVVCDSARVVRRARRSALYRDLLQVGLMLAVDVLFIRYPLTHIPMLDRDASMLALALFNAGVASHIYLCRALPPAQAKRIAGSWCASERRRFRC